MKIGTRFVQALIGGLALWPAVPTLAEESGPPDTPMSPGPAPAAAVAPSVVEDLNDRVTELEVSQSLNRARFSGVFVNRFEALRTSYGVPGDAKEKDSLNAFGSYLGLNIDFDVTRHIKLYTTLAMTKFWQNSGRNEHPGN
jgi:hypothetical protein